MIERPFWLRRIEDAWHEAPIAWLSGVRRLRQNDAGGKLGAERVVYVNCDLPIVEDMVHDPPVFFRSCRQAGRGVRRNPPTARSRPVPKMARIVFRI